MELSVHIKVSQLGETVELKELDALFTGEISAFESWFMERQRSRGAADPVGLVSLENGIIRGYLYYLYSKETP